MASATELVNFALVTLGQDPIDDIADDSYGAKKANVLFKQVLEYVEGLGPWRSCMKRATLARLTEVPAFGYDYYYQLPTDCYKIFEINETKAGEIDYEVDGNKVATDEETFNIRYGQLILDVEKLDVYLLQAIREHMIVYLTYSMTANQNLFISGLKEAKLHAKELMSYSSLTGNGKDINPNDYLDVRW